MTYVYGDIVEVIAGFYKGQIGKVVDYGDTSGSKDFELHSYYLEFFPNHHVSKNPIPEAQLKKTNYPNSGTPFPPSFPYPSAPWTWPPNDGDFRLPEIWCGTTAQMTADGFMLPADTEQKKKKSRTVNIKTLEGRSLDDVSPAEWDRASRKELERQRREKK